MLVVSVQARDRAFRPIGESLPLLDEFPMCHIQSPVSPWSAIREVGGNAGCQMGCKSFNQIDRPVTATGTPYRDRSVFLALLHKSRQDQFDEAG